MPSISVLSYLFALGATLSFATASLVFTDYSKKISVLWMNCFKAFVAFIALVITIPLFVHWKVPAPAAFAALLFSGLIGLNIGDLFLLNAFTKLGPGRTLILFGFQPLLLSIAAFFLFDQPLEPKRLLAIIFLMACLFTFSLERYRQEKRWEVIGLFHALVGVLFDLCGILLTRWAFARDVELSPIEGHLFRCTGALLGFLVIGYFRPIGLFSNFKKYPVKSRAVLILAGLGGTYLSLILYLNAIKIGHLGSIAAISITGPMFATALECVVKRQWPSRYVLVAFVFFCAGFYILFGLA